MNHNNSKKQIDSQFICKLCDMMEKFPDHINWDQNGQRMVVSSIWQLQKVVLPQYFRHSNFNSFIRQLNMYDFHKIQKDEITNQPIVAFEHSIFKRGNQRNFHFIQRKKKNKEHDTTTIQFQKKYQFIIQKLKNYSKLNQDTKNYISNLIEFKFTATENSKKLKNFLQNICKELKECRSKKISHTIKQIKEKIIEEINQQVVISKNIDRFLQRPLTFQKQNINVLSNQFSSNYFSSFLTQDTRLIPDILFTQKPNFLFVPSHCGFINPLSGHDLSSSHPLLFSNPQFLSDTFYENKNQEIKIEPKVQEDSDNENSMEMLKQEELEDIIKRNIQQDEGK